MSRSTPVSFDQEVLPILRKNCVACHNASDANGDLVLESPDKMIKGGDTGPAVTPGKGADSLLLKVASHQVQPIMPPPGNDVAAVPLTSQELGLIKLWIDQGAKSSGLTGLISPTRWRPLPPGTHPILTATVTPDGQFVACGRANQIFIYHAPTGQLVTRLTDPALQAASPDKRPGIAEVDVVQSLAFNPQGDLLASRRFPHRQALAVSARCPAAGLAAGPRGGDRGRRQPGPATAGHRRGRQQHPPLESGRWPTRTDAGRTHGPRDGLAVRGERRAAVVRVLGPLDPCVECG